jgi:hypothetical protein
VWRRTPLALWTTQRAAVGAGERACVSTGAQKSVAHWQNNQIADQSIGRSQRLQLMPFWDPLLGDSRFEKIIASLAPRDQETMKTAGVSQKRPTIRSGD